MFELTGFEEEINELIKDIEYLDDVIDENNISAAMYATEVIESEQKRILGARYPHLTAYIKRKVKSMTKLKTQYENSLDKTLWVKVDIGFCDLDYRIHPELYILEFGRPGHSSRALARRQKDQLGKLTHIGKDGKTKTRRAKGTAAMGNPYIDKLGRIIGVVQPVSAIRWAWFEKRNAAIIRYYEYLIDKAREVW